MSLYTEMDYHSTIVVINTFLKCQLKVLLIPIGPFAVAISQASSQQNNQQALSTLISENSKCEKGQGKVNPFCI